MDSPRSRGQSVEIKDEKVKVPGTSNGIYGHLAGFEYVGVLGVSLNGDCPLIFTDD